MLDPELSRKILSVGPDWTCPKGGIAQVMANLARYVHGTEHYVSVANSGDGSPARKLWIALRAMGSMAGTCLRKREIEAVHIHTASYKSFERSAMFGKLARMAGKKVIYHIHGGGFKDYFRTRPEWIRKRLREADALAVLSPSWRDFFAAEDANSNIHIINNIVSDPERRPTQRTADDTPVRLLFLGAICDAKGIFDLIDVIAANKSELAGKLKLTVGGNGETDRLTRQISEHSLADIVDFAGWVSGDRKAELLAGCDYYILPSYTEGLPLSILEAMTYGKPVLSTPVGGIPEVVDETNGMLFGPGDKEAILSVLRRAIARESYARRAANATRVASAFLPAAVEKQINDLYHSII